MDVFEAIRTRRSVRKVKPDPVPQDLIEKVLEAATWAPCHFLTEPWRFIVLQGEGRELLGEVYVELLKEQLENTAEEESQLKLNQQMEKAFRAPAIIIVISSPSVKPHVIPREEFAAGCAAIQNMLLAAHALGLGAIWRTGHALTHPRTKEIFQLKEHEEVLGFIYLGFPDQRTIPVKRTPYQSKTTWIHHKTTKSEQTVT
ncbi:nitroreductase family protein [Thermoflavimicrobium dichotomicum]|uniref:Putative NAD(P)H nitroreductase n=1 Tax=Thermoflavimicrobium dichotomicum TaxID=46223 RepID=A0A1I3L9L8_9BACL|nr:nitroreductase [Thermoflavimicrobium dichotomicum]SFI81280.1 Nitroreductase [Thermoflavimicrobium dichotomicum]